METPCKTLAKWSLSRYNSKCLDSEEDELVDIWFNVGHIHLSPKN